MTCASEKWFLRQPTDSAKLRIFCFPFTGGGAAMFCRWPTIPGVDVIPIQYPGRQNRYREPPITSLDQMVIEIFNVILPYVKAVPFCFFGYSMGGIVAMYVANRLQKHHHLSPLRMIFAGTCSPHMIVKESPPVYSLPDNECIQRVTDLFALQQPEIDVMSQQLAPLRADLQMIEEKDFPQPGAPPFSCPFVFFYGTDDLVYPRDFYEAMRQYTQGAWQWIEMDGIGHFFESFPLFRQRWLEQLRQMLRQVQAAGSSALAA